MSKSPKSKQDFEDLLVSGYIRNAQNILINIIPKAICIICFDYHGFMDYFSKTGESATISDDGLIVTRNELERDNYKNTCYGTKWINSNEDKIVTWKLKILYNEVYGIGIFVGIANNDSFINGPFFVDTEKENNTYYAYQNEQSFYSTSHHDTSVYGQEYGQGDIITMQLNLKKASLEFYKNGESQGIASKNIVKSADIRYKLIVSMFSSGDSVQIIDFEKV